MIFLEYLCEKLYGPPFGRRHGTSYWPCPKCDSPKFHTMPPKSGCKDRAKCYRCNWLADGHDLLIEHGVKDYGERRMQIEQWKKEYVREVPLSVRTNNGEYPGSAGESSPRGGSRRGMVEAAFDRLPDECLEKDPPKWAKGKSLRGMYLLVEAADLAQQWGVTLDELAACCARELIQHRDVEVKKSKHAKDHRRRPRTRTR
jgi:hypothetical protein